MIMDDFHIHHMYMLRMDSAGTCPDCWNHFSSKCTELHPDLLEFVQDGNVDKIKDYIDKDGDVNALRHEEGLLSRACSEGQLEIVKLLLLQCPHIHVNIMFEESSPLIRAAQNEHFDCVKALLKNRVACGLSLAGGWKAVAKCLQMQPQLHYSSIDYIMRNALPEGIWDVIEPILEMGYAFEKDILYSVVLMAVNHNRWDIVYAVFKRDFCGKTEVLNEVLAITVNMRNWEKVEAVMHYIGSDLKFNVSFVEAALAGRLTEVQRLLTEKQYDSQNLNGSLLVVAAGGTDDPVAELLMTIQNTYTKRTLSNALFLASLGYRTELLLGLLHNREASYSINDYHHSQEVLVRLPCYGKRAGFLVTYFNDYITKKSCKLH